MHPAAVGFHCPDDVVQGRKSIRQQRTSVGALLRNNPPYVTGALIAANLIVYFYTASKSVAGMSHPYGSTLFRDWDLLPSVVHSDHEYYRLITSAFLHLSGLHIASNMITLFVIGPPVERLLGPVRFAALYALCALGGSAAVYAFGVDIQPVAGASGAIFGLFAASLIMVRQLRLDPQWLIGMVVLNFVLTFSIAGISKLGHVGGFVTGLVAALAIAGPPNKQVRVRPPLQAAGLGAVALLVLVVIAVRTATW
jgi:membrane associated rhomboid family serine protease